MGDRATQDDAARVLIVDDEPNMRLLARRCLEMLDCEVFEAGDGAEALRLAEDILPDMVFLDVVMPGLDGFEVCARLRAMESFGNTPIVMMTALDDLTSIDRSYSAGATDFITKPVNWTLLQHRVRFIRRASAAFDELSASQEQLTNAQRIARLASWRWLTATDEISGSDELVRLVGTRTQTHTDFLAGVHPHDRGFVRQTRAAAIRNAEPYAIDYRFVAESGDVTNVHELGELLRDRSGEVVGLVGTLHDVTERMRAADDIRRMTYHDAATGLPNRRWLLERLETDLANGTRSAALVHVELGALTRIRESLGLEAADAVVCEIGAELSGLAREASSGSATARVEGNAFQVLIAARDAAEVHRMAVEWVERIGKPREQGAQTVVASAHAGIALIPEHGTVASRLIQRAQGAASTVVAGQVALFDEDAESEHAERLSIAGLLHGALEADEFELAYQPIVDLRNGRVHSLEALIRWKSPVLGAVPPSRFVPIAEESGLVGMMAEWVLRRAFRDATAWHRNATERVRVAINLSATQLNGSSNLFEVTQRALNEFEFPASCLEYEITEGVLIETSSKIMPTLQRLRRMGVTLSLDDFGTGYSSLAYLARFPVSTLKIDRSFVTELSASRRCQKLVAAIMAMAHGLELEVVTEGVEDQAQLEFVRSIGGDFVQGYVASRPISAVEVQALVDRGGVLLPPAALRATG